MQERKYNPPIKIIAEVSLFPEDTLDLRRLQLYNIVSENITSDFSAIECNEQVYLIFDFSNFYKVAKLEETKKQELEVLGIHFWEAELNNKGNLSKIRRLPVSRMLTENPETSYFVTEITGMKDDIDVSFDFKRFRNLNIKDDYWRSFIEFTPDFIDHVGEYKIFNDTKLFLLYCTKAGIITEPYIVNRILEKFFDQLKTL